MAVPMFPTKEAFDKEMEKMEVNAIPWRDLKVDEIYRIEEKREVLTRKIPHQLSNYLISIVVPSSSSGHI